MHRSPISENVKPKGEFVSVKEFAAVFPGDGKSRETIRRWARRGLFGAKKDPSGTWIFRRTAVNEAFGYDVFGTPRDPEANAAAAAEAEAHALKETGGDDEVR